MDALVLYILWMLIVVFVSYVIIRLGVRHGVMDANERMRDRPAKRAP
jgi:SNF family Na+-dependent transporter